MLSLLLFFTFSLQLALRKCAGKKGEAIITYCSSSEEISFPLPSGKTGKVGRKGRSSTTVNEKQVSALFLCLSEPHGGRIISKRYWKSSENFHPQSILGCFPQYTLELLSHAHPPPPQWLSGSETGGGKYQKTTWFVTNEIIQFQYLQDVFWCARIHKILPVERS